MERDDTQLIDAVLSGDDSAFGVLVEKHQKVFTSLYGAKLEIFTTQKKLRRILSSAHIKSFLR